MSLYFIVPSGLDLLMRASFSSVVSSAPACLSISSEVEKLSAHPEITMCSNKSWTTSGSSPADY